MAKERTSVRMRAQIKSLSEQGHSVRPYCPDTSAFAQDGAEVFGAHRRAAQ